MGEHKLKRRGFMLVLSSPSGAGKTTISRLLLESDTKLSLSISSTTRPKRPQEQHEIDYYFTDEVHFEKMIKEGEFLEYAKVFNNYYGTPKFLVERELEKGRDVLFDIDWQGTQQLAAKAREDLVSIYILPPSMEELERRLRNRGQDSDAVIKNRMEKSSVEISHWDAYDYVIINYSIEESLRKVSSILRAERLRRVRQPGLPGFVGELLKQA